MANDKVSIHIDKKEYKSPNPTTGAALYILGSINSTEYDLYREASGHGDDELIANNATPVKVKDGDHLFSVKKKLNPGSGIMGLIPQTDDEYLSKRGFDHELQQEGSDIHLIIKGWQFPDAYVPAAADILIIIPAGYPNTALDMFWTYPDIKLANGDWPAASDYHQTFGDRSWQRWSRHYQGWRGGIDDLRSFITSMEQEISLGI